MRFTYFTLSMSLLWAVSCTGPCKKAVDAPIPTSVAGKTLQGTFKTGTGAFAGLENTQFAVAFDDPTHFTTKTDSGAVTNTGDYTFQKTADKNATLELKVTYGEGIGQKLRVDLSFDSNTSGTYQGKLLDGGEGTQTGIFKLVPSVQ